MTSFKEVPKVPLVFLISAAKSAKDWTSMKREIVGKETDSPIKVDRFVTKYHPHSPYSRYNVLQNYHSLFLAYSRAVDDPDTPDVSLELRQRRVYSLSYFNAYYSEQETAEDRGIRDVWTKVDGLYQLIWG